MSLSKFQESVMDREAWRAAVHGVTKGWLSSWQGCQRMHPEMDLKEKEDGNGSFLLACLPFFFIFLFPF